MYNSCFFLNDWSSFYSYLYSFPPISALPSSFYVRTVQTRTVCYFMYAFVGGHPLRIEALAMCWRIGLFLALCALLSVELQLGLDYRGWPPAHFSIEAHLCFSLLLYKHKYFIQCFKNRVLAFRLRVSCRIVSCKHDTNNEAGTRQNTYKHEI